MKKVLLAFVVSFGFLPLVSVEAQSAVSSLRETMVLIEGGSYIRGSIETPYAANERHHRTTVSSFSMAKTETTQALWREVMGNNPAAFKGDERPVESTSWLDAVRFCNALSAKEGLTPAYEIVGSNVTWDRAADGYRLPTEAEWEYAARGGVIGAVGIEPLKKAGYAGGTDPDAVAWFDRNSGKASHPVGRKAPNELGLFDMSGNVWEWCWDWYGPYPDGPIDDPQGLETGTAKVLRGGAWFTPLNLLRTTYRYWNAPSFKVNSVGFRVVRNAQPPAAEIVAEVDFFTALSAPDWSDQPY